MTRYSARGGEELRFDGRGVCPVQLACPAAGDPSLKTHENAEKAQKNAGSPLSKALGSALWFHVILRLAKYDTRQKLWPELSPMRTKTFHNRCATSIKWGHNHRESQTPAEFVYREDVRRETEQHLSGHVMIARRLSSVQYVIASGPNRVRDVIQRSWHFAFYAQ